VPIGAFNCPEAFEGQNAERAENAARRRAKRAEDARGTARYVADRLASIEQEKARFEREGRYPSFVPAYPWQCS
jgi:hypothetical protein